MSTPATIDHNAILKALKRYSPRQLGQIIEDELAALQMEPQVIRAVNHVRDPQGIVNLAKTIIVEAIKIDPQRWDQFCEGTLARFFEGFETAQDRVAGAKEVIRRGVQSLLARNKITVDTSSSFLHLSRQKKDAGL